MCLIRIGRKIKNLLSWIADRSYKVIIGTFTFLWMLAILLNPPITVALTALWGAGFGVLTYSWKKAKGTTQWTLKTAWQQLKDWREGRRRRKEAKRAKEYDLWFPKF